MNTIRVSRKDEMQAVLTEIGTVHHLEQSTYKIELIPTFRGEPFEDITEALRVIGYQPVFKIEDDDLFVEDGFSIKFEVLSTVYRPENIDDKEPTNEERISNALEGIGKVVQVNGELYKIGVNKDYTKDLRGGIESRLQEIGFRPFFASKEFHGNVDFVYVHILTTDILQTEVIKAGSKFDPTFYDQMYDNFKEEDPTGASGTLYFRLSDIVEDITYMMVNETLFPVAKAKMTKEYMDQYHCNKVLENHDYLYGEYLDDPSGDKRLTIFGSNLVHATNEAFAPERSWISGDYMYIALRNHD